jgi:hypothetical protein
MRPRRALVEGLLWATPCASIYDVVLNRDCCCQAADSLHTFAPASSKERRGIFVKFLNVIAICAFAVASLGLGACASKKTTPPPPTTGYSK